MTISRVAVTTPTGIGLANATFDVSLAGAGVQQNDVIVAIHGAGSTLTPGNPAGYTSLSSAVNMSVGYLIAGASPPSTVTFPVPSGGTSATAHEGIVYVLRGVDTGAPSDASATTAASTNPAAITPGHNGACVICAVSSRTRDTSPGTNDGSDGLNAVGANVTNDSTMAASVYYNVTTSGVDPGAFSSLTSSTPAAVTVAFREAINAFTETPTDPMGLTDSASVSRGVSRSASEAMGLTDSAAALLIRTQTPADVMGLTDTASRVWAADRAATETEALTDVASRVWAASRAAADTLGLVDSVVVEVARFRTVTDDVGLTETWSEEHTGGTQETAEDDVGLSDSVRVVPVEVWRYSADVRVG